MIYNRFDIKSDDRYHNIIKYERALLRRIIKNISIRNHQTYTDIKICKVKININKLPDDMKIYRDIHSYPYAVYVDENIPTYAIESIEPI